MTRVAAIDCGTNSTRLLIADVDDSGYMQDLVRDMRITRLGQGVDRSGQLSRAALERTFMVAADYRRQIQDFSVEAVRVVSTSATRDAKNRRDFVQGMQQIFGVAPEVISGEEEAALSFAGAISFLTKPTRNNFQQTSRKNVVDYRLSKSGKDGRSDQRPGESYLVVDIGGGSTEFVQGTNTVQAAISTNMGSVRLSERFGPEPWDVDKQALAVPWIHNWLNLADEAIDFSRVTTVVGVAGTVTTIAAYALGVSTYTPEVTHGARLSGQQWQQAMDFMINSPVARKAELGFMPRGRAEVIGGGTLIWREILTKLSQDNLDSVNAPTGLSVVVSEHDILDGIALSLAKSL